MNNGFQPEDYLSMALGALGGGAACRDQIDQLPVPVYVTDAFGAVTYWNRACVDFAGREPQLGKDRWCVTWKLFSSTGEPIPHDQCPMAQAIRRNRSVRGQVAIAERPDGRRVAFRPYPTPLRDSEGRIVGAVNMLIDVTKEQGVALVEQAQRCRRLAKATYDRQTLDTLEAMAHGFERTAEELRAGQVDAASPSGLSGDTPAETGRDESPRHAVRSR